MVENITPEVFAKRASFVSSGAGIKRTVHAPSSDFDYEKIPYDPYVLLICPNDYDTSKRISHAKVCGHVIKTNNLPKDENLAGVDQLRACVFFSVELATKAGTSDLKLDKFRKTLMQNDKVVGVHSGQAFASEPDRPRRAFIQLAKGTNLQEVLDFMISRKQALLDGLREAEKQNEADIAAEIARSNPQPPSIRQAPKVYVDSGGEVAPVGRSSIAHIK